MDATPSRAPQPPSDLSFDGNVLDLDRVLASAVIAFTLHPNSFPDDSLKSAYLLSHFRGSALDWAARLIDRRPESLSGYATLVNSIKLHFGYDAVQVQAIAQTQLGMLQQKGDMLEFLLEYDDCCARAGITSDASKIAMVFSKLNTYYRESLISGGDTFTNYSTIRSRLINVHSRRLTQAAMPDKQRKRAKCSKCGKPGHTGTQCLSKN